MSKYATVYRSTSYNTIIALVVLVNSINNKHSQIHTVSHGNSEIGLFMALA